MMRCGGDCATATVRLKPDTTYRQQRENDYRFLMSSHRKNGPPMMAVTTPTGISSGASAVREIVSHATTNAAPPNADAGQHEAMIGADHQPNEVGHDDSDESDRAAERHSGPGCERRAEKREALRAVHVNAAARGALVADRQQVHPSRQHGERCERQRDGRQRRQKRRVTAHVEIAHQPADGAKGLREVRQELHEQNERREERVQRDPGEQQHVRRKTADAARARDRTRYRPRQASRRSSPWAPQRIRRCPTADRT